MLCNLNVDGQTWIAIGIGINAAYFACNHLVKNKPNWLHFVMGVAAALAIFFLVLGLVKLKN